MNHKSESSFVLFDRRLTRVIQYLQKKEIEAYSCDLMKCRQSKLCQRIRLWYATKDSRDYSPITLQIKEKDLRENFEKIELQHVKKRVEIVCISLYVLTVFILIADGFEANSFYKILYTSGDILASMTIMTILGRFYLPVHNFTNIFIVLVRAARII